jgi:hypothetical protein
MMCHGARRSRACSIPPHPPGGVHEEVQLPSLVVPRDLVAGGDRSEPTLRTQREIGDRHVLRGFVDASKQILL